MPTRSISPTCSARSSTAPNRSARRRSSPRAACCARSTRRWRSCRSTRTAPSGVPSKSRKIRRAPCAAENRDCPYFLGEQVFALGREALARLPREAAFRELVQAADRVAHHGAGAPVGVAIVGAPQRLLERRLEAVEELVHACPQ